MAANCNIIPIVWDWVSQKSLGLTVGKLDFQLFVDFFNITTGCKEVIPCHEPEEQPCEADEIYLCNFLIGSIDVDIDPTGLTVVGAPVSRYTSGFPPYGVHWTWDPLIFSHVSGQGTPAITLQKLPGVAPGTQTVVDVRADDGNGCKDSGSVTFGFPEAIVECAGAFMTPVDSYVGIPYSGTITIAYGGGNGGPHAGLVAHSTGVTGLTATLPAGNLATGDGTLVFNVTGVPEGNGPAAFSFNLFSDTPCVFNFNVAEARCQPTQIDHVYHPFDIDNNWYPVEILWIPNPNATSYRLEIQYSIGAPQTIIIPAPASSTFIFVPPLMFFGVQIFVTCLFDSTPVGFTDTAPAAPPPCPAPTNFSASMTGYDPITAKFTVQLRWDIMTGATAYIVRNITAGTSFITGSRIVNVQVPANTSTQFGVKTDCGNLAGESPESLATVNTPTTPVADPSPWPVIHYIDNVSTQLLNSWFMQMWLTLDGNTDWVRVFQNDPFRALDAPDFLTWPADSGNLFIGADNGYTPTPPGFGPNDIFFGTSIPPKGRTIQGSGLNYVKVAVVRGTAIPFQGSATYFNYWMNVPEQYTVRMSNEDYITTDPSFNTVRPTLSFTYPPSGGAVKVTLHPTLNYDACSKYNMFLVSEAGGIMTKSSSAFPPSMSQTFSGLAPGRYLLFAEHTHDACVTPGNVETALPVFITIA